MALLPSRSLRLELRESLRSREFQRHLDPGEFDTVEPRDREVGMMLYTSGSTGRPKGVLLSHASQLWALQTARSFYSDAGTVLLLCQANDLELEEYGPVLKAVCASLRLEEE